LRLLDETVQKDYFTRFDSKHNARDTLSVTDAAANFPQTFFASEFLYEARTDYRGPIFGYNCYIGVNYYFVSFSKPFQPFPDGIISPVCAEKDNAKFRFCIHEKIMRCCLLERNYTTN
jgi:hypothetical protein